MFVTEEFSICVESSLKNFKQCVLADDPGEYGDGAGMDNKVSGSTDMVERRVMPLVTLGQGCFDSLF